ncbi:Integrase core domain-containing protein [Acidocella aminolytica 101 = DSM 11237]|uniref:Integrase catalytic domain-containing protein n=1 Tax=Acidocella aminolytica 101 = DSM 11237 TaxID=1120923 RepID=A0A0D6PB28_9PROT|nr:hypothetical protein Aam_012_009 [Acidocella aminolytica 101 = DSM 11237]SHF10974.1 Integrase core domain-containing protein [Acidocella aminolytica 101 = DSM 11237]
MLIRESPIQVVTTSAHKIQDSPGKPQQNAVVDSFNGRFRDECLNVSLLSNLGHAWSVIEATIMLSDHTSALAA